MATPYGLMWAAIHLGLSLPAQAQSQGISFANGITLQPQLTASYRHDDNISNQSEATRQQDSLIRILEPELTFTLQPQGVAMTLFATAERADYEASAADNYQDSQLRLALAHQPDLRHYLRWSSERIADHQQRGQGISAGQGDALSSPIERVLWQHQLTYRYGASGAEGELQLQAQWQDNEYRNHPELTAGFNWQESLIKAAFYYRVGNLFQLLLAVSSEQRRYQQQLLINKDSQTHFAYTGVRWQLSGNTQGELKLGLEQKQFADPDTADYNKLSWAADLNWQLRPYSRFSFSSQQRSNDPEQGVAFAQVRQLKTAWHHDWQSDLSSQLSWQWQQQRYPSLRLDRNLRTALTMQWQVTPQLAVALSAASQSKHSTLAQLNYDKHLLSSSIRWSF